MRVRLDAIIERAGDGSEIAKEGPRSSRHTIQQFEDHHMSVSDPVVFSAIMLDQQIDLHLQVMKQTVHTSQASGQNIVLIESYLFLNSGNWVDPVSKAMIPVTCGHVALIIRVEKWQRCGGEAVPQEGCGVEEEGKTLEVRVRMVDCLRWAVDNTPVTRDWLSSRYRFDTDSGSNNRISLGYSYLAAQTSTATVFNQYPRSDHQGSNACRFLWEL